MSDSIRVRMAPSPTGMFHVGSARTALFNYLYARHCGGSMVLRIEDTDTARNAAEYEEVIYQAMAWLGLHCDEGPRQGGNFGPYRQSDRLASYREMAQRLVESGAAYPAYETAEELTAMRAAQQARKEPPRYTGAHRTLTATECAAFEAQGRQPVLRFAVPAGQTGWDDIVRGLVSWQNSEIDDFVIVKSDGWPTYNFACVVDDALMQISHVIRGEDGLSNTPRQLLLYQALNLEAPHFAHLPFLLGHDRSKLSKRHGAVNLLDFRDQGIQPQAMVNYLALLGWNPGEGETQELFTEEELIQRFSLESVNKAGAIFDAEKLAWVNVQYLKQMPVEDFVRQAEPWVAEFLPQVDLADPYVRQAFLMGRERIHQLADIRDGVRFFFTDDFPCDAEAAAKHLTPQSRPRLAMLADRLQALLGWTAPEIEATLRELAGELTIKPAELIHPARLAVSGRPVGPSLFHLLEALGTERVQRRLRAAAIVS